MRSRRRTVVLVAAVLVLTGVAVAEAQWVFSAEARAGARAGADFDGDGYDDLVMGAPLEDVGPKDAGTVSVAYGGPGGAGSGGTEMVRPGLDGVVGAPHQSAWFGTALATGDFDADGYDDLAVGAPGEPFGRYARIAGAVTVVYGGPGGLSGAGSRLLRQGRAPLAGQPEAWDRFGAELAAGDLDGDGYDDLAVGVPDEGVGDAWSVGEVDVVFGGPSGLGDRAIVLGPGRHGVPGAPISAGRFGSALAIGDLDGDGYGDLAVTDDANLSGTVTIVPGAPDGLAGRAARTLTASDVPCGCPQFRMHFGSDLATGDVNADGFDDLAIGAPAWDKGGIEDAGNVSVVFGTPDRSDPGATFDQSSFGTVPETGDWFGANVHIGSVDADGAADLVVGTPNEDMGDVEEAGIAVVVRGAAAEFPGPASVLHQGALGGRPERYDFFGASGATGDFSGDGDGDVVVGAVLEDIGSIPDAGNVTVVDETGGVRAFDQGAVGGWVEEGDWFGGALG